MPCFSAAGRIEPQVGGRIAELAAALVAVHHLAGHEPGRAEQLAGLDHLAGGERGADRAGRDRPSFVLERRHDIDREAMRRALLPQEVRRAARGSCRNGNRSRSRRR